MSKIPKTIHLVCQAHLDPVWLWPWEDGMAEAVSTFRVAAEFCERVKGFIFCHNEALLYKWVEDHDPALFRRIQRLVKRGSWHIAGGSYVQPDINCVSGESHIRQFLVAKEYFRDRFGAEPTTAYNFDTFGHAEGYAQILAGCGFDSYIFCRPHREAMDLPMRAFRWRDRSGTEVMARRVAEGYPTQMKADRKLNEWPARYAEEAVSLFLWGIGNHGGGPSREDLAHLERFQREHPEYRLVHSTPERFFREAALHRSGMPVVTGEMQNIFPGCYTSMSRIKRAHRECEGLMAATERMAAMAWWRKRSEYPSKDLEVAWKDILFGEFHDILPGSSIQPAEKDSLALFGHCSDILRRVRARVFVRLLDGEAKASGGATPIFVWNPHGFALEEEVECEFHYANFSNPMGAVRLFVRDAATGRRVPFQHERPETAISSDLRMRIAVPLRLAPFQMRRLEVTWRLRKTARPWAPPQGRAADLLTLNSRRLTVKINPRTGLVDYAGPGGGRRSLLREGALRPLIFRDLPNSWTCGDPKRRANDMTMWPWGAPRERFRLATPEEAALVVSPPSAKSDPARNGSRVPPVRIVEHGPLRAIAEAVFVGGRSAIVRRYVLSRHAAWLEVRDRIYWNEKDSMLKVAVPCAFSVADTVSETPYSALARPVAAHHVDAPNLRWVAVRGKEACVSVLNDGSHAHSVRGDTAYLSVLRSPPYSAMGFRPEIPMHERRFWPRQDQGEHQVRFRLMFAEAFDEIAVSRAAQILNVPAQWMVFFPGGPQRPHRPTAVKEPFLQVAPSSVQIAAIKKAERSEDLVVRLWEQAGRDAAATLRVAGVPGAARVRLGAYGLKTLLVRHRNGRLVVKETNLIER